MSVPTFDRFIYPLAKFLYEHPIGVKAAQAFDAVADRAGLTEFQREEYLPSGNQPVYKNRIGWAHDRLKRARLSSSVQRGVWCLTDEGRKLVEANPKGFGVELVGNIAKPPQEVTSTPIGGIGGEKHKKVPRDSAQTPTERIHDAVIELNDSLSTELLEVIADRTPGFFERLVLRVLHAMGYGAGEDDLTQTPLSHDGGIDGIISLDRLGLEKVYVQAKKWDQNSVVSKPEIQKFYGALAERGSQKGVFITTSRFSDGAIAYARQVVGNIVLVDGKQLASLMIEHGVGVTVQQTVKVCRFDSDFFDES